MTQDGCHSESNPRPVTEDVPHKYLARVVVVAKQRKRRKKVRQDHHKAEEVVLLAWIQD